MKSVTKRRLRRGKGKQTLKRGGARDVSNYIPGEGS